jgi:gamma-glutamyltranspeptidase/glutathione hydrolase
MCRFDPRPGLPNSVRPRCRPLNNACPAVVVQPGRSVAVGMPGGRTIVTAMGLALHRLVDYGATPEAAASGPRLHHEGSEPVQIEKSVPEATVEALRAMGHSMRRQNGLGGPMTIAAWDAATGVTTGGCNVPAVAGAEEAAR